MKVWNSLKYIYKERAELMLNIDSLQVNVLDHPTYSY